MTRLSAVLRSLEGGLAAFWCPGCDEAHAIRIAPGGWMFDGNVDAPTFSPSILTTGYKMSAEGEAMIARGEHVAEGGRYPGADTRCHSFVRAGRIEFLYDCTHALAGQTVPLPPWPGSLNDDATPTLEVRNDP